MRRPLLLLALLLPNVGAPAQEPATSKPSGPNITIELQCIGLPQALAVPLVRRLRSDDGAEQAKVMTELDELLEARKATLQGWLVATTHNGQKAMAEDNEEIRYATEFVPSHAEVHLADKDGNANKQPDVIKVDAEPLASAFDTRNVGVTLEIEPKFADDNKSLNVSFIAQHVRLKSVDRIVVEREFTTEKKSQKTIVEMPRFTTHKIQTTVTMKNGEHRLIGIFRAPDGDKRLELFILSVQVPEGK